MSELKSAEREGERQERGREKEKEEMRNREKVGNKGDREERES